MSYQQPYNKPPETVLDRFRHKVDESNVICLFVLEREYTDRNSGGKYQRQFFRLFKAFKGKDGKWGQAGLINLDELDLIPDLVAQAVAKWGKKAQEVNEISVSDDDIPF